jgi:hypothetical protein
LPDITRLQRNLLCEMAAREVAGVHFAQKRRLTAAAIFGESAARMEIAAGWRRGRARHLPLEDRITARNTRIGNRVSR